MRLPYTRPDQLTEAQRPVYEACQRMTQSDSFTGFEFERDGVFLGPWGVLLNFPDVALGFGQYVDSVQKMTGLSDAARQVVILTVGGHFNAAYELYAHSAAAARSGLTREQILSLCAGQRPSGLSAEQSMAADVARALLRGGVLAAPTYDAVVASLGQDALDTIVFVTIHYFGICAMLNAYDVPPGAPTGWLANAAEKSTTAEPSTSASDPTNVIPGQGAAHE